MSARPARATVTAPAARPLPPKATRTATSRAPLAVVPPRPARTGRTSFVLLIGVLLSVGLAALLGINTALAQGSFTVSELQKKATELEDRSQALEDRLARSAAPEKLAAEARRIGMVPAPGVAFVGLADGSITGKPQAAPGAPPPLTEADRIRQAEQEAAAKIRAEKQRALDAQQNAEKAAAKAAEKERLAAEKAAAEKAAAEARALAEWQAKLAAQEKAGKQSGGEQVVEPPSGN